MYLPTFSEQWFNERNVFEWWDIEEGSCKEFREKYSSIQWKSMAGMQHRLIHDYFGINYEIAWDVVTNKIQELNGQIRKVSGKE